MPSALFTAAQPATSVFHFLRLAASPTTDLVSMVLRWWQQLCQN